MRVLLRAWCARSPAAQERVSRLGLLVLRDLSFDELQILETVARDMARLFPVVAHIAFETTPTGVSSSASSAASAVSADSAASGTGSGGPSDAKQSAGAAAESKSGDSKADSRSVGEQAASSADLFALRTAGIGGAAGAAAAAAAAAMATPQERSTTLHEAIEDGDSKAVE